MTTQYTKNFGLALPDFRMGPWADLMNGDLSKIDQLMFGAMSSVSTPPWTNSTHYTLGQTVLDPDIATTWMCNFDHTSAATGTFTTDRTAHPTYWVQLLAGFAPRGEWANNQNYYPYDLAYSSSLGIFGICKTRHISNPSGTMKDDQALWSFLVDLSAFTTANAAAITYDHAASGLTAVNVQQAIDQVDAVNDSQATTISGNTSAISTNTTNISNHDTRLTAVETVNAQQVSYTSQSKTAGEKAIAVTNIGAMQTIGNQTITGGFILAPNAIGNFPNPFTPNPVLGNYQYGTNNAAFTFNAPANDCAMDFLVTNSATAGAITFSGYTVAASNTGDPLTTTNTQKFIVSVRRINAISTYTIKALQ